MMRPFASTISLQEARKRLDTAVRRSAMDGYAVIAVDTVGVSSDRPRTLRLIDRIYTGQISPAVVSPGTCAEIATGAPLPTGADAVVMVEATAKSGETEIQILAPATAGQHVGRRGADIAIGASAVRVHDLLTPSRVGALAA